MHLGGELVFTVFWAWGSWRLAIKVFELSEFYLSWNMGLWYGNVDRERYTRYAVEEERKEGGLVFGFGGLGFL